MPSAEQAASDVKGSKQVAVSSPNKAVQSVMEGEPFSQVTRMAASESEDPAQYVPSAPQVNSPEMGLYVI
jgi:hypothetical protein